MVTAAAEPAAPLRSDEHRLVHEHLPLVGYAVAEIAARVPRHVGRDDLVSAGTLGLVQAARTFNPERGTSFDRYARIRIRGAITDELRTRDWASRSVRQLARRAESATDALTLQLRRTPTLAEVAHGLGVEPTALLRLAADIERAATVNYESVVLAGNGDGLLPSSESDPQAELLGRERRGYLRDAVAALPERLRRVVIGYFFEERPIAALAAELGVTESRVSQMRTEAIELLRDGMNAHLDPAALRPHHRPDGRVARRKAAYFAAVGAASSYRARLDERPVRARALTGA